MRLKLFLSAIFSFIAVVMFAQVDTSTAVVVPNPFDGGIEDAIVIYDALAVALFNIWGYISRAFFRREPKDPNFLLALAAGAMVIGGIFYWNGLGGGVELVIQFLIATKLYDFILKPAGQKAAQLKGANANQ